MYDVITIGTATLDVFIHCPEMEHIDINGQVKIAFPHGQKVEVGSALFETGGGATNTGVTFARQGLKTAVMAKIGKDFSGEKVIQKLTEEQISTEFLVEDSNDSTDFATIIWKEGQGNVLLVARGKGKLEVVDEQWEKLDTQWFYITSVEGNLEIVKKTAEISSTKGTKIAWNPGKLELQQKELLKTLVPHIELLIINRKEAALLTDKNAEDITVVLQSIELLPCRTKLVTDGHNGAYFYNGQHWLHSEAFKVERKETTGAGDAFGSAFVVGLLKGMMAEEALQLASANAASVVTYPGAKQGILKENQIEEWMNKELKIKLL